MALVPLAVVFGDADKRSCGHYWNAFQTQAGVDSFTTVL
jgi:hypothetical protein